MDRGSLVFDPGKDLLAIKPAVERSDTTGKESIHHRQHIVFGHDQVFFAFVSNFIAGVG